MKVDLPYDQQMQVLILHGVLPMIGIGNEVFYISHVNNNAESTKIESMCEEDYGELWTTVMSVGSNQFIFR